MEILSPSKINKDRRESDDEARERTNALADEETRRVHLVNEARERTAREMASIDSDFKKFAEEKRIAISKLTDEVCGLENRRQKALEPVTKLREEAEKLLADGREQMEVVTERFNEVAKIKEHYSELFNDLHDVKNDLDERSVALDRRERGVKVEEEASKIRLAEVNGTWVTIIAETTKVKAREEQVERREIAVSMSEKATQARHGAQDQRERDLNDKETAITDRQGTLERAFNRLP